MLCGKARRTLVVAAAQLPQHRQQGVAHQRVDLVDQQHQRLAVGRGPATQRHAQCATWPGAVQGLAADTLQRVVAQRQTRPERKLGQYGAHTFRHVLAHRLACLDVGVHAAKVALRAAVQQIPQHQQRRGLAGLSRRVQHEVLLVPDQAEHRVEIDPLQRRDMVVVRSHYGPLRVERAHVYHGRIVTMGALSQSMTRLSSVDGGWDSGIRVTGELTYISTLAERCNAATHQGSAHHPGNG